MHTQAEDYRDEESGVTLLSFSCTAPTVTLPGREEAQERINAALEAERAAFTDGEAGMEGLSGAEGFLAAAREDYSMRKEYEPGGEYYGFHLWRTVNVQRADGRVLSMSYMDSTYTGGVHGYSGIAGWVFDTQTGEPLALADLAEDGEAFLSDCVQLLRSICRERERAGAGGFFDDYEDYLPDLLRDGNWYFDGQGVTVIANPYEIAPSAAGVIEFSLPYDWLALRIKPEYLPPETASEGTLAGEIAGEAETTYALDDGTDGMGALVVFTAEGDVTNVRLSRVSYYEYSNVFLTDEDYWYADMLRDGESLSVRTWIPEILPDLQISFTDAHGREERYLISQSGMDGSLALLDAAPYDPLPLEISGRLPFSYDLDGDGDREIIDLTRGGGDTRWMLTVDGVSAGDVYALDAELISLWLVDLGYDGKCEILFSGDMGSDDYVTCAWRGDTLESIPFTGERRRGSDPGELTAAADGCVDFSYGGGYLYLDSWTYQLGTYMTLCAYELTENGEIAPAFCTNSWLEPGWLFYNNEDLVLTVKKPLPAFFPDGGSAELETGTKLTLTATEGSRVRFITEDGVTGALEMEYSRDADGRFVGWTIDGVPENEYFENLPYAG